MKRLGLVAMVGVALLTACGGDDDTTGTNGGTGDGGGGGGEPVEVTVAMTEFAFDPATVTVGAGAEVTVTAENQGSVEHDFVVLDQGREIAAETDLPEDLEEVRTEWAVVSLHTGAGAAEMGTFTAPAAGDYQIICMVPGHFSAGMEGTLTVEG
jgi:plastocyanin